MPKLWCLRNNIIRNKCWLVFLSLSQYSTSVANTQSQATRLTPTQTFFTIQRRGRRYLLKHGGVRFALSKGNWKTMVDGLAIDESGNAINKRIAEVLEQIQRSILSWWYNFWLITRIILEEYLNYYQTNNLPQTKTITKKLLAYYNNSGLRMIISDLAIDKTVTIKINHNRIWKNHFKKLNAFEKKYENHPANLCRFYLLPCKLL